MPGRTRSSTRASAQADIPIRRDARRTRPVVAIRRLRPRARTSPADAGDTRASPMRCRRGVLEARDNRRVPARAEAARDPRRGHQGRRPGTTATRGRRAPARRRIAAVGPRQGRGRRPPRIESAGPLAPRPDYMAAGVTGAAGSPANGGLAVRGVLLANGRPRVAGCPRRSGRRGRAPALVSTRRSLRARGWSSPAARRARCRRRRG